MSENTKKNEGIESGHDAGEPEIEGRDQILAQCLRTQGKRVGIESRLDIKELKIKKEGIESRRNAREPELKGRDQI